MLDGSVNKVTQLMHSIDHPISDIRAVGSKISNIICYSRENNHFLNIINTNLGSFGETKLLSKKLTSLREKENGALMRINLNEPSLSQFGKLSTFTVDNSKTYLICVFENSQIGLFLLETSELVKSISVAPGINLENVYIDDLTSFMACLDISKRFIHLLAF